jgi:hypothetical protein
LTDHLTGEVIDLSTTASYSFTSASNTIAAKRFSIGTSAATVLSTIILEKSHRAYFNNASELVILARDQFIDASISIHDMQGKLLFQKSNVVSIDREWKTGLNVQKGLHIIRIADQGQITSLKILK